MIVEPSELRMMARYLEGKETEQYADELTEFHSTRRISDRNVVSVPWYWAKTLLPGLKKIHEKFPQMRFGSVLEEKNRLKIYTIPTHLQVEKMKIALYNEIDKLILDTVDHIARSDKKPFFLS